MDNPPLPETADSIDGADSAAQGAALLAHALQLHGAGQLDAALSLYQQVLTLQPEHADALHLSGVIAYQQRAYDTAAALLGRAIAADPRQATYHLNLGNVQQAQGALDLAIASFRHALQLAPDRYEAYFNLGNALQAQGEWRAALDCYQQARLLRPDHAELHNNLGRAQLALQQSDAALESFRQALQLRPEYAEALNNLGSTLQARGALAEAEQHFRHALSVRPNYPEAYYNLGNTLAHADQATPQPQAAADAYRHALALRPDYVAAYFNLGRLLQAHAAFDAAEHCYREAIRLRAEDAEPYNNLGDVLAHQGRLSAALASFRQAVALRPDFDLAHSNILFHLNYLEPLAPEQYLREATAYGATLTARAQPYTRWPAAIGLGRLRIGFVSGDLREHPVGFFLESVVAHLDPARFELVAYVTKPGEDSLTARLKPHFAHWHSLLDLKDGEAARRIHDDGIQILVDLAGHTADNRLPVFAWKPAPVQVAWLGYFASTGVKEIDYIIADPQVLPESEESHFSETPWRLPDCYLCFTPPHHQIEVGVLPALANGYVTFGCFNKLSKMNDAVVALWARVLHAVPEARLLLKAKELHDGAMQQLTRARFAAHGIDPQRLLLEGFTPRAAYLAEYRRVDIALDPFPFPGGTTTVEALWMGVPVLSRRGARFISHAGESLLQTAGLGAWVAQDDDDYIQLAQAYAADLAALAATRAGLRAQLVSSPLCDAARFAAHLGAAFNGMWQTYLARSATQEADA